MTIPAHDTQCAHPVSPVRTELHTAACNAVAVASVAYSEELTRFRYVMSLGLEHGTPLADLARAAGITCDQAATLVNQGEL